MNKWRRVDDSINVRGAWPEQLPFMVNTADIVRTEHSGQVGFVFVMSIYIL